MFMEIESDTWTYEQIVQLIKSRYALENEFISGSTKKILLWHNLQEELHKNYDFPFTKEEIMRKFSNLMTTYRRIKKRSFLRGINNSTWEYFDLFENLYGSQYTITDGNKTQFDVQHSTFDSENNFEYYDVSKIECCEIESEKETNKKTTNNNILEFLKEESNQDAKYHEKILDIEREKLKIEKRRLDILFSLKNAFVDASKRNHIDELPCKKSKIHKTSAARDVEQSEKLRADLLTDAITVNNKDDSVNKSIEDDNRTTRSETNDFIKSASLIMSELKPATQKKAKAEILLYLSELFNEDELFRQCTKES